MATLARYARLFRIQLRMSATMALQYRAEFLLKGVMTLFWLVITIAPLAVVYAQRPAVAGWSFSESLVVLGWFSLLKAILEGGVAPSLTAVVEGVRTGSLDYVLLKPADAQFLVSTARFEPWRVVDFAGSAAIFFYAFHRLGRWPRPGEILVALALLVMAILLLYSIWILVVSASFGWCGWTTSATSSGRSSTPVGGPSRCSGGRCDSCSRSCFRWR
jgi:ABC-2 type transport system permease protein